MRWINNRNFDGIHSAVRITYNGMAHLSASIVWILGTKKKIDHLLYASTRRYVSPPVVPIAQPIVKEVEKVVEAAPASVEKVEQMEVKVAELQMPLPTVHFKRGNAMIDETAYADQLQKIVAALKSVPDAKMQRYRYGAIPTILELTKSTIKYRWPVRKRSRII